MAQRSTGTALRGRSSARATRASPRRELSGRDDHPRDGRSDRDGTIAPLVEECELSWLGSGIPRATVDEMAAELRAHLQEAAADGKAPEAVVGRDLRAFAVAWAEPYRVPVPRGHRLLNGASALAAATVGWLAAAHVLAWDTEVPLRVGDLALFALIALAAPVVLVAALAPRTRLDRTSWRGPAAGALLGVGLVAAVVLLRLPPIADRQPVLLHWPWPATAVLVLLAVGTLRLAARRDPTRRSDGGGRAPRR